MEQQSTWRRRRAAGKRRGLSDRRATEADRKTRWVGKGSRWPGKVAERQRAEIQAHAQGEGGQAGRMRQEQGTGGLEEADEDRRKEAGR